MYTFSYMHRSTAARSRPWRYNDECVCFGRGPYERRALVGEHACDETVAVVMHACEGVVNGGRASRAENRRTARARSDESAGFGSPASGQAAGPHGGRIESPVRAAHNPGGTIVIWTWEHDDDEGYDGHDEDEDDPRLGMLAELAQPTPPTRR